jgi:hypothetical protein
MIDYDKRADLGVEVRVIRFEIFIRKVQVSSA